MDFLSGNPTIKATFKSNQKIPMNQTLKKKFEVTFEKKDLKTKLMNKFESNGLKNKTYSDPN
jgi:hypothetical protein